MMPCSFPGRSGLAAVLSAWDDELSLFGCSLVRPAERCGWCRGSCGRSWRRREVAPYILLLGRRLVAEVLVGVVSTRAGRPVVVLVRLLPVACRSVKGNEKIPLVTEPSAYQKL